MENSTIHSSSLREYECEGVWTNAHSTIQVFSYHGRDSRTKVNMSIMEVFDLVVNECRSPMIIQSMEIPHFMVYTKKFEK